MNSLSQEEYETFTLTLINGRKSLTYNEVSIALVSYEVRRQDRLSSSESKTAEALAVRGRSSNGKRRDDQGRLKSRSGFRDLKRNQCALCKELGHLKVDCLKAKGKKVSQTPMRISHKRVDRMKTHRYSLSLLLLLLLITQIILSGS